MDGRMEFIRADWWPSPSMAAPSCHPRRRPWSPVPIRAPDFVVDGDLARQGAGEYGGRCGGCHGGGLVAGGQAPDLRASGVVLSGIAFATVVRDGSRQARGMPAYPEFTADQLLAMRHYIRHAAEQALAGTDQER